jgi:nucleoside-diphosphate-sugar epimerase
MKKQAVLVTGCAGFIGSNFVRQFKARFPAVAVVGLDNLSTGRRDAVAKGIAFYKGSIADAKLVGKIMAKHKPGAVFHFAALPRVAFSVENPAATTAVNVGGTVTLLEAAAKHKVKRFIFSSSSSVYGNTSHLPTTETQDMPSPISPYALQKYVGEQYCRVFSNLYGLDTVCLRYFNVFGPGQYGDSAYSTVVSAWLEALYFPRRKKAFLEGDCEPSRDFCYVDEVVRANILAMQAKRKFGGAAINVAQGQRTNLLKVKQLIEKGTGRKLQLEHRPSRIGDIKHTLGSMRRAQQLLGFKPKVSFEQGLRRTIEWFEQRLGV